MRVEPPHRSLRLPALPYSLPFREVSGVTARNRKAESGTSIEELCQNLPMLLDNGLRCFYKEAVVQKWKRSQIITFEIFHIAGFLVAVWILYKYIFVLEGCSKWATIEIMGRAGLAALFLGIAVAGLVSYLRQKKERKEDA